MFEIFFQLGILKQDIKHCNLSNADLENMEFIIEKGDNIKFNNVIRNMLLNHSKTLERINLNANKVSDRLKTLTHFLIKNESEGKYSMERPLCYEDIIASHKLFIFTCPCCYEKQENIAHNWVLAKTPDGLDYRLVCSGCRGVSK